MDLSSLPNYPRANPPQQPQRAGATGEPATPARWGTMVLQLAIIAGVWAGIYMLNHYSRNISEGFQKDAEEAKAEAALQGKWQSTHSDGTILELRGGHFACEREGRTNEGDYSRHNGELSFTAAAPPGSSGRFATTFRRPSWC